MAGIRTCLFMCLLLANKTDDAPLNHSAKKCPPKCICAPEVSELGPALQVKCGGQNLTSVPSTTFDKPVSSLNVSFNNLSTLEDNTFFQYESVNYIYLEACNLVNISDKTFQHLENLIFVDLSDNLLNEVSPNLFNGNHRLSTLIIRKNDLSTLQWNTTLLNGPQSLSFLDIHKCQISNLSSVTFSSLPNLKKIDISNNNLAILYYDTLSALQQLQDVNLENNPFICGLEFETLLSEMQSNPSLFHNRTLACQSKNGILEIWRPNNQSSLHRPKTTPSVTPSHESDTNENTTRQPSATLSHNPDTNTNTTLKSSTNLSNKSDASRNTTDNPTTPSDNPTTPSEGGNDTIYWTAFCSCVAAGFLAFVICRGKRHNQQDNEPSGSKESKPLTPKTPSNV